MNATSRSTLLATGDPRAKCLRLVDGAITRLELFGIPPGSTVCLTITPGTPCRQSDETSQLDALDKVGLERVVVGDVEHHNATTIAGENPLQLTAQGRYESPDDDGYDDDDYDDKVVLKCASWSWRTGKGGRAVVDLVVLGGFGDLGVPIYVQLWYVPPPSLDMLRMASGLSMMAGMLMGDQSSKPQMEGTRASWAERIDDLVVEANALRDDVLNMNLPMFDPADALVRAAEAAAAKLKSDDLDRYKQARSALRDYADSLPASDRALGVAIEVVCNVRNTTSVELRKAHGRTLQLRLHELRRDPVERAEVLTYAERVLQLQRGALD